MKSSKSFGRPKVRYLQDSRVHIDEYVVPFDIPMDDVMVMEVLNALHNLSGVVLDCQFVVF